MSRAQMLPPCRVSSQNSHAALGVSPNIYLRIVKYELLNLLLHSLLYTFKRETSDLYFTLHSIKCPPCLLFGAQQHASSALGVRSVGRHSPVEDAVDQSACSSEALCARMRSLPSGVAQSNHRLLSMRQRRALLVPVLEPEQMQVHLLDPQGTYGKAPAMSVLLFIRVQMSVRPPPDANFTHLVP